MVTRQWNSNIISDANYKSLYEHTAEVALPGYYAVDLLTPNAYAEVTVTGTHAAMHRYTCRPTYPDPQSSPCVLLLDVCHGFPVVAFNTTAQCKQAQIYRAESHDGGVTYHVDAYILNRGDFSQDGPLGGIQIYLHAKVSAELIGADGSTTAQPLTVSTWENGVAASSTDPLYLNLTESGSLGLGFMAPAVSPGNYVQFLVRSAISFVSLDNAKGNMVMQQQSPPNSTQWLTFEQGVQKSVDEWEKLLDTVTYSGGVADSDWHRRVFDAAMYRAHLPPSTYTEYNGQYLGLDMHVHTIDPAETKQRWVSDLSIWDIFRTQTTMLMWTRADIASSLANSMIDMHQQNGNLPKWVFANIETGTMVGLHSAAVFADYSLKGLRNVSKTPAEVLDIIASGIRQQSQQMLPHGYIPQDNDEQGASNTQDYAIDAGAVVMLANFVGNSSIMNEFYNYSQMYRNVWENSSQFFCPRYANGTFECPSLLELPYPFERRYTEGNAWQYRWYAPHDVNGLISLFSSPDAFATDLFDFMLNSFDWLFNTTLPNPYFWAGNEPDIQSIVMFNWAGNSHAYLTSIFYPELLDCYYIPYASGIPGNDDYGAMSAWVFWGYVGIFPMVPSTEYALFAPRFDSIDFQMDADSYAVSPWYTPSGEELDASARYTTVQIRCTGRPTNGVIAFVANITLNGVPLTKPIVTQEQLLQGATGGVTRLEFQLTNELTTFGQPSPSAGGQAPFIPQGLRDTPRFREKLAHLSF